MARPPRPVFLDRPRYRQSRLRDAARALPALGAVLLILLPLLWPAPGEEGAPSNAAALLYMFGAWAGLIAAAALLSLRLRSDEGGPGGDSGATEGAGTGGGDAR